METAGRCVLGCEDVFEGVLELWSVFGGGNVAVGAGVFRVWWSVEEAGIVCDRCAPESLGPTGVRVDLAPRDALPNAVEIERFASSSLPVGLLFLDTAGRLPPGLLFKSKRTFVRTQRSTLGKYDRIRKQLA